MNRIYGLCMMCGAEQDVTALQQTATGAKSIHCERCGGVVTNNYGQGIFRVSEDE